MKKTRTNYSQSFKQQVLDDFFPSGMTQVECYTKWKIPQNTLSSTWKCKNELFFLLPPPRRKSNPEKTAFGRIQHSNTDKKKRKHL